MKTILGTTSFECGTCGNPCVAEKFVDTDGDHRIHIEHELPQCNTFKTLNVAQFMQEAFQARMDAARVKAEESKLEDSR